MPNVLEDEDAFPNYALLSFISSNFITAVRSLNERRRIFCTAEYPLSFNGEEAIVCLMDIYACILTIISGFTSLFSA